MPSVFRCPSDKNHGDTDTDYVMVTGVNAGGRRSHDKAILLAEVHGLGVNWIEPRDITLEELAARLRSHNQTCLT